MQAVNDVSFRLDKGEVFGLAGESGSGKSTIARMILGLVAPSAGDILFEGRDFLGERDWRKRSDAVQMVFQNPGSSLNPRRSIGQSIAVPLTRAPRARARRSAVASPRCSNRCNCRRISPSATPTNSPADRSSAPRSRARSPSSRNSIVLDEPTSALDVSVQAKIIELLDELRTRLGLTYIFISHDLSLMRTLREPRRRALSRPVDRDRADGRVV